MVRKVLRWATTRCVIGRHVSGSEGALSIVNVGGLGAGLQAPTSCAQFGEVHVPDAERHGLELAVKTRSESDDAAGPVHVIRQNPRDCLIRAEVVVRAHGRFAQSGQMIDSSDQMHASEPLQCDDVNWPALQRGRTWLSVRRLHISNRIWWYRTRKHGFVGIETMKHTVQADLGRLAPHPGRTNTQRPDRPPSRFAFDTPVWAKGIFPMFAEFRRRMTAAITTGGDV